MNINASIKAVIEESILQDILNSFLDVTSLAPIIVDKDGNTEVKPSKEYCEPLFCQIIQSTENGKKKCFGSYARAGAQSSKFKIPYVFRCHAGLVGFAVPIIKNNHICTIICGKVLMWEPEDYFWTELEEMTSDLNVDFTELKKAAADLPIISSERVQASADLLFAVGNYMVKAGIENIEDKIIISNQQNRIGREIQKRKQLQKTLISFDCNQSIIKLLGKEKHLISEIKNGNYYKLNATINEILDDISVSFSEDIKILAMYIVELMVVISRAIIEMGVDAKVILDYNSNVISTIYGINDITNIKQIANESLYFYLKELKNLLDRKDTGVIFRAMNYIRRNFKTQISLTDVAKEVNLSTYHLSRIFKKETGITIMEYLTTIRIEEAKKLLRDNSIDWVVRVIGYNDISYFTKVFKKYEGIPPGEYKRRCY